MRWLWKLWLALSSERLRLCLAPFSETWSLCWNPSIVRWLVCWLSAYPSCVRWWLSWLCIASVRGCIGWREELCIPGCIYPKSSVEVPCVGVLCGQVSGNPFVWRRGRRAGCSNLEINLGVCVWSVDSNSLSLSFILCLALIHIVISYIYAWLWLFVCLACV